MVWERYVPPVYKELRTETSAPRSVALQRAWQESSKACTNLLFHSSIVLCLSIFVAAQQVQRGGRKEYVFVWVGGCVLFGTKVARMQGLPAEELAFLPLF
jgi:hypothetical protein